MDSHELRWMVERLMAETEEIQLGPLKGVRATPERIQQLKREGWIPALEN